MGLIDGVINTLGVLLALQLDFDLSTLAVMDYSLNDTIAVFDRNR